MGQLRDKRIVQSRTYLDPNQAPIPPYDYDYSYPITVYEAVKRTMDDTSTNLQEELESIYRLINGKQDIIDPGVPGHLMTWTGMRGQIGSAEVVRAINPDPALRSHQKIPSERAVGDALDSRVTMSEFNEHASDNSIHVTDIERSRWNASAPMSSLQAHIGNVSMHITEAERGKWNAKADQSDFETHIYDTNNPHNTTAHQVGTYTRREIDEMFENLHESFFNYLNISWDDRTSMAELVEYHPGNWNPNFILGFNDPMPDVSDPNLTYFALKPATDYQTSETQDCLIYVKRPGLLWQEVGFQSMGVGDMVIRYPDTSMFVWVQGRFLKLFTGNNNEEIPSGGNSDMMWRPSLSEDGTLTWTRSKETDPPGPMIIKGEDGYTPIKGIDYVDGKDGQGVPVGGRPGEVLVKITDENFDTTWKSMSDVIGDIIIGGGSLPDGIVKWDQIDGRPEWYNELGDNEDGFITQKAASRQFEVLANNITQILEKIDGPGGLDSIKQDVFDHINDFNNPHRVTTAMIGAVSNATFVDHTQNFENPHNVTAGQLGLGNVNNTSDLDKPISNAVQEVINNIIEKMGDVNTNIEGFNFITNVSWNNTGAILTFVYRDGTELDVNIPITDIFNSIYFDPAENELVIVLPDGTEHRIDIAALIQVYFGSTSSNIQVEVGDNNVIKATILPGSVGELEITPSVHLRMSPTTTTQPISDKSTRIATTEFVRNQVIDNLISYETDRALSANMGRILNQRKADIEDVINIVNDLEGIDVIDNLNSTNPQAALSANMGRQLDLTKAPRVHTSPSGSTFGRATISVFGHVRASDIDPLMDGTVFKGTDNGYYSREDHRHPTDITRAPIHFPDVGHNQYSFTGEPRSTLPPDDSNDDRIVTTEWVRRNGAGMAYGICKTSGVEKEKIVTLRSTFMEPPVFFLRQIGSTVAVTFMNEDRSGHKTPTLLNVEGTGAAEILYGGFYMKNGMIGKNHTHVFVFDGVFWRLINPVAGTGLDGDMKPDIDLWPDEEVDDIFTVTFDPNGGTVTPQTMKTRADGRLASLPTPVRSGYNFEGWWTSLSTSGVQVTLSKKYLENTTLYARWGVQAEDEITITLNPMGGSVSPSKIVIRPGMVVGTLPDAVRDKYIFKGWWTTELMYGTQVTSTTSFQTDTEIFARWEVAGDGNPINKLSGYIGTTVAGIIGEDENGHPIRSDIDHNGNVDFVQITMSFNPRKNKVRIDVSRGDSDFACLMSDGRQYRAFSPKVIHESTSAAVIQFQIEDWYSLGQPCQLVYTRDTAFLKIVEIDADGGDIEEGDLPKPPTIETNRLPDAILGEYYSQQLKASGDKPIMWGILSGSLPNGITMNQDGVISGTPTKIGKVSFTIQAVNSSGQMATTMSLNVDYPEVPDDQV